MTRSQFHPATQNRARWNFGSKIGLKRPFNQKQIWAIHFFLDREERILNRALRRPQNPRHVWSGDFVMDRTYDGKAFRMLAVIEKHGRQCLATHLQRKLKSDDAARSPSKTSSSADV
ncbi:MAG: hypothetical protein V2J51_08515 [Erythrobacter sp.]|jgi:hypothetical protein|nr:hypothetical protein [Erythrobacter sp.]